MKQMCRITQYTVQALQEHWVSWMNEGYFYYQLIDYRSAFHYMIYALDVAKLQFCKPSWGEKSIQQLGVSTIFISNIYQHLKKQGEIELVLAVIFQFLGGFLRNKTMEAYVKNCMRILLDRAQHASFIEEYTPYHLETIESSEANKLCLAMYVH